MNVIVKMPIYPQTLVNQCCKSKNMFDKVSLAQHTVTCIVSFIVRRNSTRFVASGFQLEPTFDFLTTICCIDCFYETGICFGEIRYR